MLVEIQVTARRGAGKTRLVNRIEEILKQEFPGILSTDQSLTKEVRELALGKKEKVSTETHYFILADFETKSQ